MDLLLNVEHGKEVRTEPNAFRTAQREVVLRSAHVKAGQLGIGRQSSNAVVVFGDHRLRARLNLRLAILLNLKSHKNKRQDDGDGANDLGDESPTFEFHLG